ncbi:MAG: sigma 54-interacting transcriptional regulator, partial [Candidatus Cloacimonetes bacterium]|nr:sigma 54-interacting transcriptional regulator [Candidatus Cloacimonadota bacterium]
LEKDYYYLVHINLLLSKCYNNDEAKEKVKPCLELAEIYARESGDLMLMESVYNSWGYYYRCLKDEKNAIDYLQKAISLHNELPVSLSTINTLTNLSTLYHEQNNHEKVIRCLTSALAMSKQPEYYFIHLRILNNLCSTYILLERFNLAEELLEDGLKICREENYYPQMILMMFTYGILATKQQQFEKSIERYNKCLTVAESVRFNQLQFYLDIYNNLAVSHGMLRETEKSIEYMQKAEEIANKIDKPDIQFRVSINKAQALIRLHRFDEAMPILKKAIKYFEKNKNYASVITAKENIALIHEMKGDYKRSISVHKDIHKTNLNYIISIRNEKANYHDSIIKELSLKYDQVKKDNDAILSKCTGLNTPNFVGKSEAFKQVLNYAMSAAQHPNASVFIVGESGTGKEILAHIIHTNSIRKNYAFVPVNCSAISTGLIESELFGHKKGAFTGAVNDTKGVFIRANKGTLFLDEITEMPFELQAKLLRAIETKKVLPVGSSEESSFDSRIISSSNRDIYEQMKNNEFRLDLFHRLNMIEIVIPPLRDRLDDIEPLVQHFIELHCKEMKVEKPVIERSFYERLRKHDFPGNVRELKNIIERLFILSDKSYWDETVLSFLRQASDSFKSGMSNQPDERELIIKALVKTSGKQKDAAKLLKMTESTLTRRIAKYCLQNYTKKATKSSH